MEPTPLTRKQIQRKRLELECNVEILERNYHAFYHVHRYVADTGKQSISLEEMDALLADYEKCLEEADEELGEFNVLYGQR
jgi:hypothetical protein